MVKTKNNCAANTSTRSTLCFGSSAHLQEFQHPSRHCSEIRSQRQWPSWHSASLPLNVSSLDMGFVSTLESTNGILLILAAAAVAAATCRTVSSASSRAGSQSCLFRSTCFSEPFQQRHVGEFQLTESLQDFLPFQRKFHSTLSSMLNLIDFFVLVIVHVLVTFHA